MKYNGKPPSIALGGREDIRAMKLYNSIAITSHLACGMSQRNLSINNSNSQELYLREIKIVGEFYALSGRLGTGQLL